MKQCTEICSKFSLPEISPLESGTCPISLKRAGQRYIQEQQKVTPVCSGAQNDHQKSQVCEWGRVGRLQSTELVWTPGQEGSAQAVIQAGKVLLGLRAWRQLLAPREGQEGITRDNYETQGKKTRKSKSSFH